MLVLFLNIATRMHIPNLLWVYAFLRFIPDPDFGVMSTILSTFNMLNGSGMKKIDSRPVNYDFYGSEAKLYMQETQKHT